MDEKPDQIAQHIESKRSELGRNLDELQNKVRDTTDWRKQFEKHPYVLLGAAMGGGMLLSSVTGSSSSSPRFRSYSVSRSGDGYQSPQRENLAPPSNFQRQKAWGVFENIKVALFGLAAARAQEFLNDMLPGFKEHFHEAQSRGTHSSNEGYPQQHHQGQTPQQANQGWNQGNPQQHFEQGHNFNQPERWNEPNQGQWPHPERNWERERDQERRYAGAFEGNQPGGFRR